ncbi:VapE domain-containing protein [Sorangium sp. So ce542]|uniref:VapE domain-containing protein n=1 Tax=Sorangium sp. So ce542 TaxID=3133316 RepID=UPI003F5E0D9A
MNTALKKAHEDELAAPLVRLEEYLNGDASRAFTADVIDAAARLEATSAAFQRVLNIVQEAGTRIRDWRNAVNLRRQEFLAKRAEDERRLREVQLTPEQKAIDQLRPALLLDDEGRPRRSLANLSTILSRDPRWEGKLAYHALRERVVIVEPIPWHADDAPAMPEVGDWKDHDSTRAAAWVSREWDLDMPSAPISEVIEAVARKRIIDPLVDYLGALRHDGVPRIDTWLSVYLGVEDTPYTRAVGARWLISAVARAYKPGCKVDCVLILEGRQGIGKSSALRALCADPTWFFDDELPFGDKDASQNIRGKWIIELGELSFLNRHELAVIKSFITRQVDTYRPSFGRRAVDIPRHCVFAGSTNEETYLRDEENRRFWPVRCSKIDLATLEGDRDQLWAEATSRFLRGEPWHVDSAELAALCRAEQDQRVQTDPWDEMVSNWLGQLLAKRCEASLRGDNCLCVRCKGVTPAKVLTAAIGVEPSRQTKADENRVAAILKRFSWQRGKLARRDGVRIRPFYPPTQESSDIQRSK